MQPSRASIPISGAPSHPRSPTRHRSPPAKRRRTSTSPYPSASSASNTSSRLASPEPSPTQQFNVAQAGGSSKWFRKPSVVWYRGHDLRVDDHPALLQAAQRGGPVLPLFVWDPNDGFGLDLGIVKKWWLRESLRHLERDLRRLGVQLYTRTGCSTTELRKFLEESGADAVFWNRCYEPDLLSRDEELRDELAHEGLTAESFKAELLVEPWELSNTEVSPCYDTFHEYMRAWMRLPPPPQPFPCPSRLQPIAHTVRSTGLEDLGLDVPPDVHERMCKVWSPGSKQAKVQLERFLREVFPAFGEGRCRRHFDGTSRLSPHIRFGEISPRRMYHATRLRVSRWDQFSGMNFPATGRVVPRSGPSGKPGTTGTAHREKEQGKAHLQQQNGSIGSKRRREGNANGSSFGNPVSSASPELCEKPKSPINNGDGGKLKGKGVSHGQRPSQVAKKPVLPHISLSARAFLKNLCLRDFSYHVLFHNPDFGTKPLIPEFSSFPWADDNGAFESWRCGKTGYPIVDAAMRELRETGWIHNGMRFLLACFLTKYLLLPWSRGLKEFYGLLVDGDHSANALGWQWTAGSNTDAFPLSCLVNPVKVASRHDPAGTYVRKWVPELANLPNQFLHEPWKASSEMLKSLGIEIGKTYPNRIVQVNEARNRALDAMRLMKRIFSGSTVLRGIYSGKEEDIIKEWPEEHHEILQVDDSSSSSGKMSLLPSLWALLQCDQASTYLSGSSAGNESLIAMDTASLAEGALAVPLDDQHESIEHALITAHEQVSAAPNLAATVDHVNVTERSLDVSSFENEGSGDPHVIQNAVNGLGQGDLEERLKYDDPEENAFHEDEKLALQASSSHVQATSRSHLESDHNHHRVNEGVGNVPFPATAAISSASAPQHGPSSQAQVPYSQQPQQHFHHFQQLQQLQQIQQLQQFHLQQQQQPSQHPSQRSHSQPPPPIQSQASQPPQQQQHVHIHTGIESMYGAGSNGNTLHGNSVPGVAMTGTPIMMGTVTGTSDGGINSAFPAGDAGTAFYGHQLGVSQFYGMPQVLPVMNPYGLNGADRIEGAAPSGQSTRSKVAVPGVLPFGYGMYGGGIIDPAILGNPIASGASSYGLPVSSQQQTSSAPAYGVHPHAMYFGSSPGMDMPYAQANGSGQHLSNAGGNAHRRFDSQGSALQANSATAAVAAAAVAAGGREVAINVASDTRNTHRVDSKEGGRVVQAEGSENTRKASGAASSIEKVKSGNLRNGVNQQQKASHGRAGLKATSKGRGAGRNRRSSASGSQGRSRTDSRGNASPRNRSGDGSVSKAGAKGNNDKGQSPNAQATTLKTRQEILASVLEKEDHEYHEFAQFLSITYELTGNTDRHTSKDYVRLCNLKDDYHKRCKSDKEKLKIYRIKAFFSKILKLEVTGEWDRHNHGGVRGPYVYGIRMRKLSESSKEAAQN